MDYRALKGLVETVVSHYTCPSCGGKINENQVDVIGAAGNTLNIDIACKGCGKHSMLKSEVLSLDLSNVPMSQENIKKLKGHIQQTISQSGKQTNSTQIITDAVIVELNTMLRKNKIQVSDLFGGNL